MWIRMEDGVRLAASLFLPEGAEAGRAAPVVLEALPYRKDDATASYRPEYERLAGSTGMRWPGSTCGDGVLGRGGDRRVPGERAGRPVPGDRLAGRPVVVDRVGRDVRDQLLGVAGCSLESSQTCANVRAREWAAGGRSAKSLSHPAGRIR